VRVNKVSVQRVDVEELKKMTDEIVKVIKELGLEEKLDVEVERLKRIAEDLVSWVRRETVFTVRPYLIKSVEGGLEMSEYLIEGFSIRRSVRVGRLSEVKLIDIYNTFFSDTSVFSDLLKEYVEKLKFITNMVEYQLLGKIKYVVEKYHELESQDP
jgi:ribosomal protein S13